MRTLELAIVGTLFCVFSGMVMGATFKCPSACTQFPQTSQDDDIDISDACYVVSSDTVVNFVRILSGGELCFQETDAPIIFKARSILVLQNGKLTAGSPDTPYGSEGGSLRIQLYGEAVLSARDPASQAPAGINCVGGTSGCYPERNYTSSAFCCDESQPTGDPCGVKCDNDRLKWLSRFVPYGDLPFDNTPWGYKVLGVSYGGTLQLYGHHGVKSPSSEKLTSCPIPDNEEKIDEWAALGEHSWARLARSYAPDRACCSNGVSTLVLDHETDWNQGDLIVVTTTGWHMRDTEIGEIIERDGNALKVKLWLSDEKESRCLQYFHYGTVYAVPDSYREGKIENNVPEIEGRALVGLLSRSIVIESIGKNPSDPFPPPSSCQAGNSDPNCYFGGHIIARQGFGSFEMQGVEIKSMGQGGRMGHYPLHFHLAKETSYTIAFAKDCSVWDSMNRITVIHTSNDVLLQRNVGAFSVGHAYYLEDATEINNKFCSNLAISTRAGLTEHFEAWNSGSNDKHNPDDLRQRAVPAILWNTLNFGGTPNVGRDIGTDTFQPSAFWMTNMWNDWVGNAASGVAGIGVCYWFSTISVSGPSRDSKALRDSFPVLSDYDNVPFPQKYRMFAYFNFVSTLRVRNSSQVTTSDGRFAMLRNFAGNTCSTSAYSLYTSFNPNPDASSVLNLRHTPFPNPYGITRATAKLDGHAAPYARTDQVYVPVNVQTPQVLGDQRIFAPCPQRSKNDGGRDTNGWCTATVVDRYTTSFNWAEVNFGSMWIRNSPFWLISNSAITDQLYGGLNLVAGGGTWTQVPIGTWSQIDGIVFVGALHSLEKGSSYLGPEFPLGHRCTSGQYCVDYFSGAIWMTGSLQPKRLLNIYDGPFSADNSICIDTPPFTCNSINTQDLWNCTITYQDSRTGETITETQVSIYSTTNQPCTSYDDSYPFGVSTLSKEATLNNAQCPVQLFEMDGRRQNLFKLYLPNACVGWKQPNGFYYPPAFGMRNWRFDDSSFRHNVVDKYVTYSAQGLMEEVNWSTIINDIDGSFSGVVAENGQQRSSSISTNAFLQAVGQEKECASYGLQVTSSDMVTLVVGNLVNGDYLEEQTLGGRTVTGQWVKIWRQNVINSDETVIPGGGKEPGAGEDCEPCNAQNSEYFCGRASYLMNPGTAPAALVANGATYWIDMSRDSSRIDCVTTRNQRLSSVSAYPMARTGESMLITTLFAHKQIIFRVQFYAGDGNGKTPTFEWVRYMPHQDGQTTMVILDDDYSEKYNKKYPNENPDVAWNLNGDGIVEVIIDNSIDADEIFDVRGDDLSHCMPQDMCTFDSSTGACKLRDDFHALQSATPALRQKLKNTCYYWATRYSGTTPSPLDGEDEAKNVTFAECPSRGCLGLRVTLGNMDAAPTYNGIGNTAAYLRRELVVPALVGSKTYPCRGREGNLKKRSTASDVYAPLLPANNVMDIQDQYACPRNGDADSPPPSSSPISSKGSPSLSFSPDIFQPSPPSFVSLPPPSFISLAAQNTTVSSAMTAISVLVTILFSQFLV